MFNKDNLALKLNILKKMSVGIFAYFALYVLVLALYV